MKPIDIRPDDENREPEYQPVNSIEGLYDAAIAAHSYNLADRRSHSFTPHRWDHAYLRWDKDKFSHEVFIDRKWPARRPVKLCRKCKEVECVHTWQDADVRHYKVSLSTKYAFKAVAVAKCAHCGLRLLIQSAMHWVPTADALDLLHQQYAASHINTTKLPSGYHLEFPAAVSEILESNGREAAITYIQSVLQSGNCQDAFARTHGPL